ncbi:MAG: hypothetical protein BM556_03110 [Bacteriovorax sp. MedPE-SWde]|nr:MAG: hypothetical protein BM556_03110 [Bacteriovorax sp. MedPE-SWde]
MIIKIENMSKSYLQGKTTVNALKNINLEVEDSQSMAIVGPSGSGKTTLLSLLGGLDLPTSGSIKLRDKCISSMTEEEVVEFRSENIGIVFQQFHLMPHLTALENVCLPLEIMGDKNPEKLALEFLDHVGLSKRADHFPHQMSGGECQRVAIARATVTRPKILLADEPSGNLDTETGIKVMDLIFKIAEENQMNLILVTHDIRLANRCQKQVHLTGGLLK